MDISYLRSTIEEYVKNFNSLTDENRWTDKEIHNLERIIALTVCDEFGFSYSDFKLVKKGVLK